MSKRKIIRIDEDKCTGCGLCVDACAEGALEIVDGKAKLVREIFCDGLGACLGDCPEGALTIEERDADEFDEDAVRERIRELGGNAPAAARDADHGAPQPDPLAARFGGCPGSALQSFDRPETIASKTPEAAGDFPPSALGHWPVQLMLVPPHAPFLKGKDLLICADCVPFALRGFHERYLDGRAVVVGCPKLDDLAHYREKLAAIFEEAKPASVTVLRMQVPCCGGISHAVLEARDRAVPDLPVEVHTVGIRGEMLSVETDEGTKLAKEA